MGERYQSGSEIITQENESGHGSGLVRGFSGVGDGNEFESGYGKTYFQF